MTDLTLTQRIALVKLKRHKGQSPSQLRQLLSAKRQARQPKSKPLKLFDDLSEILNEPSGSLQNGKN